MGAAGSIGVTTEEGAPAPDVPGSESAMSGGSVTEGPPAVGGIAPATNESADAPLGAACVADASVCAPADAGPIACVPTGSRDCSSDRDNDCNGEPDNVIDDVCTCLPGAAEPCDEHPGLDGRGQCHAGSRVCVASEDKSSSAWGACDGAVGPGAQDSCDIVGDDSNCDGTNNGGCPCIEGEARPCGPETEDGVCQRGSQTCTNGAFGQCVGAVFPSPRDCRSDQDNDCNGLPDNTIDGVCTCAIGSVQACGAHPGRDGNGQCLAGSQSCQGGANNATSGFGACVGSVGPLPRDSCDPGNDGNCNGVPNEGCACVNGQSRACGPDTEIGACQRGTQECANGTFGACSGATFAGARNCASAQDNDCDGRPDNTLDNVCTCALNSTEACNAHPGLDGIGECRAGQRRCEVGAGNASSSFGECLGSVGAQERDSCGTKGNDANCDGIPNGGCNCGTLATTGNETCRTVRRSLDIHGSDLGGIAGADSICVGDFGAGWKALLVGSTRRATITPFVGDGQLDWVIAPDTYYFNEAGQLVWHTDASALLGVTAGRQQPLLAPLEKSQGSWRLS